MRPAPGRRLGGRRHGLGRNGFLLRDVGFIHLGAVIVRRGGDGRIAQFLHALVVFHSRGNFIHAFLGGRRRGFLERFRGHARQGMFADLLDIRVGNFIHLAGAGLQRRNRLGFFQIRRNFRLRGGRGLAQGVQKFAGGLVAHAGIGVERTGHQGVERIGPVGVFVRQPGRIAFLVNLAGQHFDQDHAQRIDIGGGGPFLPLVADFRSEVMNGLLRLLNGDIGPPGQRLGHAEIGDLEQIGKDDDVVGLEIAMRRDGHGGVQRLANLGHDVRGFMKAEHPFLVFAQVDDLAQGQAFQVLAGEPVVFALHAFVMNAGDIGVVDLADLPDFPREAVVVRPFLGQVGRNHLEGDILAGLGIAGAVNGSGPPGANERADLVTVGDHLPAGERQRRRVITRDRTAGLLRRAVAFASHGVREDLTAVATFFGAFLIVCAAAETQHDLPQAGEIPAF
ncbi:MAG: hypothetical protein GMKNLPBB_02990 [Myxococcota bacterium]|nr:hypothetical protein [Myxococcota bacterium]